MTCPQCDKRGHKHFCKNDKCTWYTCEDCEYTWDSMNGRGGRASILRKSQPPPSHPAGSA